MTDPSLSKELISSSDEEEEEEEEDIYTPPTGFTPLDPKTKSLLNPSTLKDNELWLFKVPAGTKVSEIKSLAVSAKTKRIAGEVEVAGKRWTVKEDVKEEAEFNLLAPTDKGYTVATGAKFSKTITMTEAVDLPKIQYPEGDLSVPKKVQPEGMRMRFLPIGFGKGDPGVMGDFEGEDVEDVEMEDAPKAKKAKTEEKKSKKDGEKKSKKEKKEKKSKA
ncbi:hypothetical protein YB2330_000183 [Saitoella coloradoensis]